MKMRPLKYMAQYMYGNIDNREQEKTYSCRSAGT